MYCTQNIIFVYICIYITLKIAFGLFNILIINKEIKHNVPSDNIVYYTININRTRTNI